MLKEAPEKEVEQYGRGSKKMNRDLYFNIVNGMVLSY